MGRYKKGCGWSGKYQKILIYTEQGLSQADIAERVGMSRSSISEITHLPQFIERQTVMQKTVREKAIAVFQANAERAAQTIVHISHSGENDRVRLDAAKEVLYQVGCKPREIIETIKREYSPQEIESAMVTIREMEQVADKLQSKGSKFVLQEQQDLPPREETPSPEGTDDGSVKTSPDRPEALPA